MKVSLPIVLICVYFFDIQGISGESESNRLEPRSHFAVRNGLDIKEAIEKFLKDLQMSIPEVFTFADENFSIPNNTYVTGIANFCNISCTGLKEFNATVIYRNFMPIPKAYILILDNLNLNLNYKSNIVLYNSKYLTFFGDGSANISIKHLVFDGNVSVSIMPINATTTVKIDLEEVLVNVTGLLHDKRFSDDFGKYVGTTIKAIFEKNKAVLSQKLSAILNFMIQEFLTHRKYFDEGTTSIPTEENVLNDIFDFLTMKSFI